jgi:hypothetical protein
VAVRDVLLGVADRNLHRDLFRYGIVATAMLTDYTNNSISAEYAGG